MLLLLPCGVQEVVNLQEEFRTLIRLESRRYESLRADLNDWRSRVTCGEADFDPAREDDFKGALRALIVLEDFLIEKFDAYCAKGLFLAKTRLVGIMHAHRRAAQNILDSWKSPEWETTNERGVKWDAEQTAHLRKRLASCE